MHWFWITFHLTCKFSFLLSCLMFVVWWKQSENMKYVPICYYFDFDFDFDFHFHLHFAVAVNVQVQSQPTLMSSASSFINESSIPIPATTEKPYKFTPKKHLIRKNNNTSTTLTTETSSSPRLTVIEENNTIPSINNDNDTLNISTTLDHNYFENVTLPEVQDKTTNDCINNCSENNLSAAGITGITVGSIGIVGIICGVSFIVYRNRGLNRPQVLNDRCSNPDSSGYIDDASIRVIL